MWFEASRKQRCWFLKIVFLLIFRQGWSLMPFNIWCVCFSRPWSTSPRRRVLIRIQTLWSSSSLLCCLTSSLSESQTTFFFYSEFWTRNALFYCGKHSHGKTYRPVTSSVMSTISVTLNTVYFNHFVIVSLRCIIMKICVMWCLRLQCSFVFNSESSNTAPVFRLWQKLMVLFPVPL